MVRVVDISARCLIIGLVRMYIGTRLVGLQGILVITVIGFVAAVDTGSFSFYGLPIFYGTIHENFLFKLRW